MKKKSSAPKRKTASKPRAGQKKAIGLQSEESVGYIGQIMLFAGGKDYASGIDGWLPCDGRKLTIHAHQALFSVLGNTYGGDGSRDFALPDLRGAVPIGSGAAKGRTSYAVGATGGAEQVSKNYTVPLPEHTHTAKLVSGKSSGPAQIEIDDGNTSLNSTSAPYDTTTSKGNMLGKIYSGASPLKAFVTPHTTGKYLGGVSGGGLGDATVDIKAAGSKDTSIKLDVDVRQPFLALQYFICVEGTYPQHL